MSSLQNILEVHTSDAKLSPLHRSFSIAKPTAEQVKEREIDEAPKSPARADQPMRKSRFYSSTGFGEQMNVEQDLKKLELIRLANGQLRASVAKRQDYKTCI